MLDIMLLSITDCAIDFFAGHRGSGRSGRTRQIASQLVQHCLRFLQHRRLEAFGEPTIDRREEAASLRTLALVEPQPGKASRCAQSQEARTLPLSNGNGLTAPLGPGLITSAIELRICKVGDDLQAPRTLSSVA
jgi:hypothetical protein